MELIVATRNKGKCKEIKSILRGLPIKVLSLEKFKNVPEVIEDGRTLQANAKKKARQVSKFLKKFVVADDSGLEIASLGNRPGVFSARFSGKGATYKSNNQKVLKLLKGVPRKKRSAQFRCVIAIADKGKVIGISEGRCKGKIGFKGKGKSGFGYDPIFIPDGHYNTFAEIGLRKKNKISHRARALVKARVLIKQYLAGLGGID